MAGRPSEAIKILAINPEKLAIDVVSALRSHVARLTFRLSPQIVFREVSAGDGVQWTDLGMTVQALTRFAQTGDTDDWGDASGSADAAQTIVETLFSPAIGDADMTELSGDADPKTELGAVLLAAKCRSLLAGFPWPGDDDEMRPVPVRELAALASVSHKAIYALQTRGELAKELTSEAVRVWLSGRGVPGYK